MQMRVILHLNRSCKSSPLDMFAILYSLMYEWVMWHLNEWGDSEHDTFLQSCIVSCVNKFTLNLQESGKSRARLKEIERTSHVNRAHTTRLEYLQYYTVSCTGNGTHRNETCHTYEWEMSHIWMRHVTRMKIQHHTCHTCKRAMSHM